MESDDDVSGATLNEAIDHKGKPGRIGANRSFASS
jgi:hypothetical protein